MIRSMSDKPLLSLIAARDQDRVIGRENRLPWRLPADLQHFKRLTLDKPIVMGRKTWESLPGLLPRRQHIVISGNPDYRAEGCLVVNSIEQALAAVAAVDEVMVIGGAQLFEQLLPVADRLYLTLVQARIAGDTWFPRYDQYRWLELERSVHPADEQNPFDCLFLTLERVRD